MNSEGRDNPESTSFYQAWEAACLHYKSGDKKSALSIFLDLANDGWVDSYVEIGNIYELGGGGITKNLDLAMQWYSKSIEEGKDADACVALGHMYLCGRGTDQDYRKAYYYFSKPGNENVACGYFALGYMNEFGFGIPKNSVGAIELYEKALEKGHILALMRKGLVEIKSGIFLKGIKNYLKGAFLSIKALLRNPDNRMLRIR